MALLSGRHSGQHGIDPILSLGRVARDVEVHEGGVAVLGHRAGTVERRLHVLDIRNLREMRCHVLDSGSELRVLDGVPVALNEHCLRLWTKAGFVKSDLCVVGLPVEIVDVGDEVRPHRLSDGEGQDDEDEPPPEGLLPVLAAPARHPGGEIVRRRMRILALGRCSGHETTS